MAVQRLARVAQLLARALQLLGAAVEQLAQALLELRPALRWRLEQLVGAAAIFADQTRVLDRDRDLIGERAQRRQLALEVAAGRTRVSRYSAPMASPDGAKIGTHATDSSISWWTEA